MSERNQLGCQQPEHRPGLVNVVGPADDVDLHIQYNSAGAAALNGAGATGTGVVTDYDGAMRDTPPDIGADEILLVLPDFFEEPANANLPFWKNKGQVADTEGGLRPDVRYYSDDGLPRVYLRDKSEFSLVMTKVDTIIATPDTSWRVDIRLVGGKAREVAPLGWIPTDDHRNYYLPWCTSNGIADVHGHERVTYEEVYPYTDLHFYSGSGGPKMTFVVRPGGDHANIQLSFAGQDSLTVDGFGVLVAHLDGWSFPMIGGIAYQVIGGTIVPVSTAAYLNDTAAAVVNFAMSFSSAYDPDLPLVIQVGAAAAGGGQITTDGVCWSTYLGGDGDDSVYASDTDDAGNYYVGGFTYSQEINFPIEAGQVYYQASPIAFVSKFGTGYEARWSTFYGGSFGIQWVRGLAVRPGPDPSIVIGGRTAASDLWCRDPEDGSYFDETSPGGGGFLAELNHLGVGGWSTYFGNGAISVVNLDLHASGRIAVVGSTTWVLPPEQDAAPAQADHWNYGGGSQDGFIALLSPGRRTYWTTYMGGSDHDELNSVRFGAEKVVCAGNSSSTNFPVKDGGTSAHDEPHAGSSDITISEFTLEGELAWSTYLGGSGGDWPGYQGLAVRPAGLGTEDVYIAGITGSADLALVPGAGWSNEDYVTGLSGLVARFSGTDRSLLWLTYVNGGLGNNGETWLEATVLDGAGRLFVGGYSATDAFPYKEAWQLYSTETEYGLWDGVLMCFSPDQELLWSTRFGGEEPGPVGDRITSIAAWKDERFFAAGWTMTDFGPGVFFPFTDPVGDDDHFDSTMFPEADAFLTAFCINGLLTATREIGGVSGIVAVQTAPGIYELSGLPAASTIIHVVDATGRLVQRHRTGAATGRFRIDLSGEAAGVYVVRVADAGSLKLLKGW